MDQALLEQMEQNQAMFVQVAHAASITDTTLTLTGLAPATLFFSDRPHRVVGHVSSADFVDLWDKGENSFAEDPPNAVLAFLADGDETPEDAVVVIRDPQLGDKSITYAIERLEGILPSSTGPVTLFIDPLGRPLSPMSVAGVNRRQRRRR
jgi:hypothetical protein